MSFIPKKYIACFRFLFTKRFARAVLMNLFFLFMVAAAACAGKNPDAVRGPAVSGRFYPDDPEKLKQAVHAFLKESPGPFPEPPVAIVSPHAGYVYSGQIAADAFSSAKGHPYDTIVVLGANHTKAFSQISVYAGEGYLTPLGIQQVDTALAKKLISQAPNITYDAGVHEKEHSIEVQVPFIQTLFPKAKMVAAVIGETDLSQLQKFSDILAKTLSGKKALIIASTDLSHYPEYRDAVSVDKKTIQALASMDIQAMEKEIQKQMQKEIPSLDTCACGKRGVYAAVLAAKQLGASCGAVISYANSGDTAFGRRNKVVGYAALAYAGAGCKKVSPIFIPKGKSRASLTSHQKNKLLWFARKNIRFFLETGSPPLARGFDPELYALQGAFVTLKKNGRLRGCIGHMAEDTPLCQVVGTMSLMAAFNDRRFSPVRQEELDDIHIEISVLTPLEKVKGISDIQLGRDGVMMEKNGKSAVFLPQVAPEQGWTKKEMLMHLSKKAGLPEDAWKSGAQFQTFRAIVFAEQADAH